jgi:inosose dehydratase
MIRIANAPCSWGVLEFEASSPQHANAGAAPYQQVLDEIAQTGYAGTELGDWGFMPTDPTELRSEVAQRNLDLIAAFVPVAMADPAAHEEGAERAVRTARLLRDAGGAAALIVLADDNGSVPSRERNAGRIGPEHGLSAEQWTIFAAAADRIASAVSEQAGLRTVFHPHCGGYVETVPEIDELMGRTDPQRLGLCLDTGHLLYAGGDPLDVIERYASRIWHVHFKDCDRAVAERARREEAGYLAAVRAQLFCELGAGAVDFAEVIGALRRHGYDGWIVVEQDVFPGYGTPAESALRSREYLCGLGI